MTDERAVMPWQEDRLTNLLVVSP